jgi:chemotaxis protein methyltransferase CheR
MPDDIGTIEINLLLEAVFQRYGHDFRNYTQTSIERRIRNFLPKSGCKTISEMIPKILHDEAFFQELLQDFSITVTEIFRDPFVYRSIREHVVPMLKTYPTIKVWIAGCATGEEAYSLAILLVEEGLSKRATIFATDFNDDALAKAKEGIYHMDHIQKFTMNYHEAGGTKPFSSYYHARYDAIVMHRSLKRNITFANHNLVTDSVFGEMHLIMCRNVFIYFDQKLQDRVLNLFHESLAHGGYLCVGTNEDIRFSAVQEYFETIDEGARIYRKCLGKGK